MPAARSALSLLQPLRRMVDQAEKNKLDRQCKGWARELEDALGENAPTALAHEFYAIEVEADPLYSAITRAEISAELDRRSTDQSIAIKERVLLVMAVIRRHGRASYLTNRTIGGLIEPPKPRRLRMFRARRKGTL